MGEKQKEYEYDIAISLSAEDLAYAEDLKAEINSKLRVFLYSHNQKELVSKDGITEFAEIFRDRARIVVIIVGRLWGKTFNTELEQDAILDRAKKHGVGFLVVIPLDKESIPNWYHKSRIYADPEKYSVSEIASFVEYKFTDNEGELEQITFAERLEQFKSKIEKRKAHINYLQSTDSRQAALEELQKFIQMFNSSISEVLDSNTGLPPKIEPINESRVGAGHNTVGHLGVQGRLVKVTVYASNVKQDVNSSRARSLKLEYCRFQQSSGGSLISKPIKTNHYYYNDDENQFRGWSEIIEIKPPVAKAKAHLYYYNGNYYDLGPIVSSDQLLRDIQQWLFDGIEEEFKAELG